MKQGYITRRCRTNIHFISSFWGAYSILTRTITQQKIRSLVLVHQNRGRKKRDFGCFWITRINAVI